MKKIIFILAALIFTSGVFAANKKKKKSQQENITEAITLTTENDSVAYAYAILSSQWLKSDEIPAFLKHMNLDVYLETFKQNVEGKEMVMDDESANHYLREIAMLSVERELAENHRKQEEFLTENRTREGVFETESGLQYKVITEGNGEKPGANSAVTVHYEGRTLDGTVFDSSFERGEPATFGIANVITGWTEGLQLMSPGSKYTFYIPSDLAYGERGAGSSIKPNSLLIFDVELISISKEPPAGYGASPYSDYIDWEVLSDED